MSFIFSNCGVLNTFGNDKHFTSIQLNRSITHFNLEFACNNHFGIRA